MLGAGWGSPIARTTLRQRVPCARLALNKLNRHSTITCKPMQCVHLPPATSKRAGHCTHWLATATSCMQQQAKAGRAESGCTTTAPLPLTHKAGPANGLKRSTRRSNACMHGSHSAATTPRTRACVINARTAAPHTRRPPISSLAGTKWQHAPYRASPSDAAEQAAAPSLQTLLLASP